MPFTFVPVVQLLQSKVPRRLHAVYAAENNSDYFDKYLQTVCLLHLPLQCSAVTAEQST